MNVTQDKGDATTAPNRPDPDKIRQAVAELLKPLADLPPDERTSAVQLIQLEISKYGPELWTTDDVAAYLRLGSARSAGARLSEMGVKSVASQPGRTGRELYPAEEVRRRAEERRGRGFRSDLVR